MEIRIGRFNWKQIDGDVNVASYGGTIARGDGHAIELIKIQPTREYVGDNDALDIGFPFWSREGYFDLDDLNPEKDEVKSAMRTVGLTLHDLEEMPPPTRAVALANALLDYGRGDEGPAGWAKNVIGDRRVLWWGSKHPVGWRHLESEDREFRALQREREREERL